ncbi:MAG: DNA translocase FtsK, partial [Burkholderiaceae bacterium]
ASRTGFWCALALLLCASTALEWSRLYRFEGHLPGHAGGVLGYLLGPVSVQWLGFAGSGLVCIMLGVVGSALVFRFSWAQVAERLGARLYSLVELRREKREIAEDRAVGKRAAREREEVLLEERSEIEEQHPAPVLIEPVVAEVPRSERVAKERQKPLFTELPDSRLPQVDLLDGALTRQEGVAPETLEMTSRLIEKKLKDFGVEVRVVLASPGPVITRYEIEPATGVKGAQVVNLARDLARSLSLISIRVIETIPGKNYMALELPNAKRQSIKLSEILGSQVYNEARSLLTMGLGKDIVGNPVVVDLAKMPHVLVAGTTGSGKSVGLNAMILSLLYKAEARDVRLLMIDPKMLEMSVYEGIPHLLAPVVTDMRQAAHGLNWCVAEMERRYKLLAKLGVRNLAGYNAKIDDAKARGEFIYNPFSLTPDDPEPLQREPHIVVVIDELADLMMVVGKKIEELIARLAQKARAAGIHLILATQRPSVDVITGLIKANIPTRIAFQVSSKIDSRTILDQMGAEALLGMGDMLYMPSGTGFPIRVHGAFVSDEEVHRVVSYLKSQGPANYIEGVLEGGTVDGDDGIDGALDGGGEKDPMYDQAVEVVLKNRKASISLVQRHLKIGYNRAARLVEDMEKAGLVSSMSSSGQREILVPARAE